MKNKVLLCLPRTFYEAYPDITTDMDAAGFDVTLMARSDEANAQCELLAAVKDKEGILVALEQVGPELLDVAEKLKIIVKHGVGVDNIDIQAATKRGIVVANMPAANCRSVAELTIGLILALTRKIVTAVNSVRSGDWRIWMGRELSGKTIGIIGTGSVGREVAIRAQALGMSVVVYDVIHNEALVERLGVRYVALDELLTVSDIVSIHVPLNEATRNLIGREAFDVMKPGSYLVNVARGGIVDEAALYVALKVGKLAGAALDVLSEEPPRDNPLLELPNVIVTPHIGGSTYEVAKTLAKSAVSIFTKFLQHGVIPESAVNVSKIEA